MKKSYRELIIHPNSTKNIFGHKENLKKRENEEEEAQTIRTPADVISNFLPAHTTTPTFEMSYIPK